MSRYTDQDEARLACPSSRATPLTPTQDSQRLPEGMQRIGYDADTQRYTFRDASGDLYESAPGSRYGELRPFGQHAYTTPEETHERTTAVAKSNREAVRSMLPFALLVLVFLLVVFRIVNGGAANHGDTQVLDCREGDRQVQVKKGDTCWSIAESYRVGVEELLGMEGNEGVKCERLRIGQGICVPA
jgi:hypothetical protein